jgi:hypothetical protein
MTFLSPLAFQFFFPTAAIFFHYHWKFISDGSYSSPPLFPTSLLTLAAFCSDYLLISLIAFYSCCFGFCIMLHVILELSSFLLFLSSRDFLFNLVLELFLFFFERTVLLSCPILALFHFPIITFIVATAFSALSFFLTLLTQIKNQNKTKILSNSN